MEAALYVLQSRSSIIFPRPATEAALGEQFTAALDYAFRNVSFLAKLPQLVRDFLYQAVYQLIGSFTDKTKPWTLDGDLRWKLLAIAHVQYGKEGIQSVLQEIYSDRCVEVTCQRHSSQGRRVGWQGHKGAHSSSMHLELPATRRQQDLCLPSQRCAGHTALICLCLCYLCPFGRAASCPPG